MDRNILMTIAYDGSGFSGWQRQPDKRTVQGELETALSRFCGMEIKINGTSRTDAGVHALGQRASFSGDYAIPTENLMTAVNNYLSGGMNTMNPVGDVRILEMKEVPPDFHARFDSKGKTYRYRINDSGIPDVFRRNYCYQIREKLDIERMSEAAAYIVGTHDFKCFEAAGSNPRETTARTVSNLTIERGRRGNDDVIIEITGDGFLYNMVRIITGTLVEVGLGKRSPEDLKAVIGSKDRANAGHTAPAAGLYLVEIYY